MANKTIGEMQDMTLGGFNHTIRKMSKAESDRYAPVGSPQWEKRQHDKQLNDQRTARKEKELKQWDRDNLIIVGGRTGLLTPDEMDKLREADMACRAARKEFIADLERRYPKIEIHL